MMAKAKNAKAVRGELTELISMRLSEDDANRLAKLAERVPIPKLSIARLAMRIGLEVLEKNPARRRDSRRRSICGRSSSVRSRCGAPRWGAKAISPRRWRWSRRGRSSRWSIG